MKIIPLTIIAAVLATATPTQAAPPPPVVEVQASVDCVRFNVDVSGLLPGDVVHVRMGQQPPLGVFGDVVGAASAWLDVGTEAAHPFTAEVVVFTIADGAMRTHFSQGMDCRIETPVTAAFEPTPEPEAPILPSFEPSALWPGLELADPW